MTNPPHPENDYLWTVVAPRNGEADSIERMNRKLLAYTPNTPARHDAGLRREAMRVMEDEMPSFAEMVRQGCKPPA